MSNQSPDAPATVDDYIAGSPEPVREILQQVRAAIRKAAPDAEETIAYQIPTYRLEGNLVHFAAHAGHIGFYPTPSGMQQFREELSHYEGGKGSVRFPLSQPIPLNLIARIVRFRVQENLARANRLPARAAHPSPAQRTRSRRPA